MFEPCAAGERSTVGDASPSSNGAEVYYVDFTCAPTPNDSCAPTPNHVQLLTHEHISYLPVWLDFVRVFI